MDTRNDPIEFTHEDQLGRASTAKVFSKALLANPRRPMTVAVFGPWGSGKTSFANLLSAELRANGAHCTWFNPWQFTNVEAMTLAFFDLLATSLARNKESEYHATREAFYRYAESVSSLSLVPTPPRTTKRAFRGTGDGPGILGHISLSDQRDLMIKLFAASPKSIIVFIDDIDRLFATEIRLLIQLVKSNADFPNLKFVLLFQKETVEAALKTDGQTGADFLEKIIEVPIELPLIRGGRYVSDLLAEVAEIFGDLAELSTCDNDRWQYLLRQGILKRFSTLRQKNRLVDRLQLHKWNIESSLGIDINLVDLLGLEILRAIDYDLYSALRRQGPSLTEAGDASRFLDGPEELEGSMMVDLLSEAGEGDHAIGKVIVAELFPSLGGSRFPSSPRDDERSYRICRSKHFPKYFFEGLLPDDLSRAARRRLEAAALEGEPLFDLVATFQERGLIFEALDYLRTIAAKIPSAHWVVVSCDLGRIADRFGRRRDKSFDRGVAKEVEGIVGEMLAVSSPKERLSVLKALSGLPDAIQLTAALISPERAWFVDDDTARFVPRVCRSIAKSADAGVLEQFEGYGHLLSCWREWGGKKAATFVRGLAGDPRRFVHFARAIAPYSRTEAGIAMTKRTQYTASAMGVLEFLPKRTAVRAAESAIRELAGQKAEPFLRHLVSELRKSHEAAEPELALT